MSAVAVPRITPGMTLAVEQRDYCYGTGMALLIIRSIAVDQRLLPSMEWVRLDCQRLRDDGSVAGPFSPLVRTSALAGAVRPTGWLPSMRSRHMGDRVYPLQDWIHKSTCDGALEGLPTSPARDPAPPHFLFLGVIQ